MATKLDAGASNTNPSTDVTPPRKEKKTGLTQASTARRPIAAAVLTGVAAGSAALATFRAALKPLVVTFAPYLDVIAAGDMLRKGRVPTAVAASIPAMAVLLRERPELAADCDPAAMEAAVAYADDLTHLGVVLQGLAVQVDHTRRLVLGGAGAQAREVYAAAQRRAPGDPDLATAIAPVQTAFSKGPRVVSAQNAAHVTQQRLTRVQKQALAAQRRADKAKIAQTIAEWTAANRHPAPPPATAPAVTPPGATPGATPGTDPTPHTP